jgi:hypothetical protein
MRRLPVLLAAWCACFWSVDTEGICLPIVCGPPPPILWVWGGVNASCPTTLQDCINQAAPGDGIQINTNESIDESPSIGKGLTLTAAQGFTPIFSAGRHVEALLTGSDDHALAINGLTFASGYIYVTSMGDPVSQSVTLTNNSITADSSFGDGIEVVAQAQAGSASFDVSGNTIEAPSDTTGIYFSVGSPAGASGTIARNVITMEGGNGSGARGILVSSISDGEVSADVIANQIEGTNYGYGISVEASANATTRILDNLVVGQTGSCCDFGAIFLHQSGGTLTATIVNNTIAYDSVGMAAGYQGSAALAGLIANNIVVGNSDVGFSLFSGLSNENNLLDGNASDGLGMPGPGTITANPLFVGTGDYRLKPGSPAIDAGDDTSVPVDLTTDLDGNPRIQGAHVDIGAYETAPEPVGMVTAGASLSALAALARHRRHRSRTRYALESCRRQR